MISAETSQPLARRGEVIDLYGDYPGRGQLVERSWQPTSARPAPANMIWTRTPLRVTLGGGGTDLQSYYQVDGGFIFAMGLNQYVYTGAHRPAFNSNVTLYGLE